MYAKVLAARGMLAGLVTDAAVTEQSWFRKAAHISRSVSMRMDRRCVRDVQKELVFSTWRPQLYGLVLKRRLGIEQYYRAVDDLLGRHAYRHLNGRVDVLVNTWGNGGHFLEHASRSGVKVVTDMISCANYYEVLDRLAQEWPEVLTRPSMQDREAYAAKVRRIVGASSMLICPSAEVLSSVRAIADVDDRRVLQLPYPIQSRVEVSPETIPGRILFVGNVIPAKGIHLLIGALPQIQNALPAAKLVVAGQANALTESAGPSSVVYLGHLGSGALAQQYRQADVLVLPSYSEGCPAVVGEALAHGLPVIVSREASAYVKHMMNGVVVSDQSSDAYGEAIIRVVGDRHLRNRLATTARSSVEDHSPARWENTFVEALKSLTV